MADFPGLFVIAALLAMAVFVPSAAGPRTEMRT